jgi:hypothetical protein
MVYKKSSCWRDNPGKLLSFLYFENWKWLYKTLYVRYVNYPLSCKLCIAEKMLNIRNVPLCELSLAKELLFFCFKETWMPKRANATCS